MSLAVTSSTSLDKSSLWASFFVSHYIPKWKVLTVTSEMLLSYKWEFYHSVNVSYTLSVFAEIKLNLQNHRNWDSWMLKIPQHLLHVLSSSNNHAQIYFYRFDQEKGCKTLICDLEPDFMSGCLLLSAWIHFFNQIVEIIQTKMKNHWLFIYLVLPLQWH